MNVSTLHSNGVQYSNQGLLVHSITLTSKMSKADNENQVWFGQIGGITIRGDSIPLVVCIITSTVLILLLIIAFVLWKCCISNDKEKTREAINIETIEKNVPNQSYSSTFLNGRNSQYTSRVVELIPEHDGPICWLYKNHEFVQVPYGSTGNTQPCSVSNIEIIARPPRPRSHPVAPPSAPPSLTSLDDYSLPQISEFCAHPCQYASNNILEECCVRGLTANNFKTRSLPSCVRHKRRRTIPTDSANDLYDKVNFSKKRKNRMRNDEAAIIALCKSRSQFFNKDTDTLVDNEAVIVYDERTAL